MSIFKYLAALVFALLFAVAPTAYAQSAPPSTIDFAGVTYQLVYEESQNKEVYGLYDKWIYRHEPQGPQPSRYQQLVLDWSSNEGIGDPYDEALCPQLADYLYNGKFYGKTNITDFIIYSACEKLYALKDEDTGVIQIHTDKRSGEIVITSIIAGGDVNQGEFVELAISRYISIPIPNYDYESVLSYAYTITAYGAYKEQTASLLELLDHEGEKLLHTLIEAPVPQFILDKSKYYEPVVYPPG